MALPGGMGATGNGGTRPLHGDRPAAGSSRSGRRFADYRLWLQRRLVTVDDRWNRLIRATPSGARSDVTRTRGAAPCAGVASATAAAVSVQPFRGQPRCPPRPFDAIPGLGARPPVTFRLPRLAGGSATRQRCSYDINCIGPCRGLCRDPCPGLCRDPGRDLGRDRRSTPAALPRTRTSWDLRFSGGHHGW